MGGYSKEELYKMEAVDIYKMVLLGKDVKVFPKGFWQQPEAKQNAAKCTRYLVEEILKYNESDLKETKLISLFTKNKLGGMLVACFNNSPYDAIVNAYPNKFKEWEFKTVPNAYWNRETGIKATKWLIEEKLKLSSTDLKEELSYNLFRENKLSSMLNKCFNGSPYEAINSVYPDRYKEWEFKAAPNRYWNKENGIKATKWLIEDKLNLSNQEITQKLSMKLFQDHGLGGMLKYCFNNNIYNAINSVYPNKFHRSEFKR